MMCARIFTCWISLSILLGSVLFVRGEHFFLPKENNVFSNDLQDDWIPVSGIDKRSTRPNHGFTQMVHITPPIRYPNQPLNQQSSASNKVEVFAQPPPILGSFSEFGHATVEAREPTHALNFRPSYSFDRNYEEIDERRYQQNDFHESSEEQKPPSIVVFNAQQRHPQNYHKIAPPQSQPQPFYQNYQLHNNHNNHNLNNNHNTINNNHNPINNHSPNHNQHKNHGFKEPALNVHELAPPKRLSSYYVPNDRIYPRPPGNNKQVYAEQRPKPFLVTPADPIQQQQQQQKLPQHHQQHIQPQQHQFKPSVEADESSGYFQKYPGIVENQKLFPEISHFARPFEQTNNDHNVFIKPNQFVHNLNVGTEVRFGVQEQGGDQPRKPVSSLDLPARPAVPLQELPKRPLAIPSEFSARPSISLDLSTNSAGFTHPATRPFSKFQTQSPKNEELYRIFPVKEVNALPTFLPTPVTLVHQPKLPYFKEPVVNGGSSEYDTHEELDENDSSEQYDILKSPTKPMVTSTTTTSTTTTTTPAPRTTRKRKPSTTTTTTVAPPSDDYEEYAAVPNRQQLQLQELQQEYQPQRDYQHHRPAAEHYETTVVTTTTEAAREERPVPLPVSVNKYKKKKPFPVSRPKEPQETAAVDFGQDEVPERPVTFTQSPTTTTTTTAATTTTTTTSAPPQSSSAETAVVTESRPKIKIKYGNGTRPRFSIKDYKTSTTSTTTTTTERPRSSLVSRRTTTTTAATPETDAETVVDQQQTTIAVKKVYKPRVRPNRYKQAFTATTTTTTTTTEEPQQLQETTTERSGAAYRSKYKPGKYLNRLRTSTEAITVQDETIEQVAVTEPARLAVYSAKRKTVPSTRTAMPPPAMVTVAEPENNGLRRSSSVSPPIDAYDSAASSESMMDAASSEDMDYVATTVAVTLPALPRHKYHTSYVAERPLLPIESFFQSSMAGKQRRHHHVRR
ncbi:Hypothetical protein CINCED_3A009418 [Cinara cedri]|uniref:Insect cuticle protein n=1 Tax=Cinara cedri TaxID=506608 RepID=A0A5E4M7W1_9HEMI|nr:Hypothetical protein CINCED_3A009418 [Cinara cedri]